MPQRLFVYGSLGPGGPNEHVLSCVGGTWQRASVRGRAHDRGWGARIGYPAIVLDEDGDLVAGHVFASERLDEHWQRRFP